MSSRARPIRTLLWSLWLRTRISIVGLLGLIVAEWLVLYLIDMRALRENAGQPGEDLLVAILLIGFPTIVSTGIVLLSLSDSDDLRLGLPPRLLRVPLPSWRTVLALMGYGVVFVSLVALVAALPASRMLNVSFSPASALMMAALFATLAYAWSFAFGDSNVRIATVAALIAAGGMVWLVQRPWLTGWIQEGDALPLSLFGIGGCALLFGLTVGVMHVKRSGGWEDVIRFLGTRPSKPETPKAPFRSARAAHFWYEWKQFGWLLPAFAVGAALAYYLVLPLIVGVLRAAEDRQHEFAEGEELNFSLDWFNNEQYITTGLQIATVVGGVMVGAVMFMRAGHWNTPSAFYFTRPLSVRDLFQSRLAMALTSLAVTMAILMTLVGGLTMMMNLTQEKPMEIIRFLSQSYTLPGWVMLVLFWSAMAFCLWGGMWSTNILWAMTVLLAVFGAPIAGVWVPHLVGVVDAGTLESAITGIRKYGAYVSTPIFFAGLLYTIVFAARARAVAPWLIAAAVVVWIASSAGFILFGVSLEVDLSDPSNEFTYAQGWVSERFPHPINWPLWVGFSTLPIMPLFLQPSTMHRSRHL